MLTCSKMITLMLTSSSASISTPASEDELECRVADLEAISDVPGAGVDVPAVTEDGPGSKVDPLEAVV